MSTSITYSEKDLNEMETTALALRTMADKQLEQIGRLRGAARSSSVKQKKEKNVEANLLVKMLSGRITKSK